MAMPPNQQNPYEFIMSPNQRPPRKPIIGNSIGSRIAVVVVGLVLLIIIIMVISSFLNGSNKDQNDRLLKITQSQSEIIRLSALAEKAAKVDSTKIFAANTRVSTQSAQQDTKKLLTARGVKTKVIDKQLGVSKNPKNDAALKEATANNRYDETFTQLINQQLGDYQTQLQTAFDNATPNEKKSLMAMFNNNKLLLNEITPAQ